ncbi:MAG: tetratricopeptide repeat protein [Oryzomonas sp.]|uniref:tetratricopeptide repeat protein n=1 Tax=Oryzomonas sp. TaxID=2855186 RepID=UPI002843FAAF|nr:tetratricopeptide repeat protein [Oryzomonas sp.]MDR3578777.1 tetratricopeptide repeat protein [Oryzomonas sp.]
MMPERIIALVLALMLAITGGCGMLRSKPLPESGAAVEQERRFAGALQYLLQGKERAAEGLLEQVVAGKALPGVTDEALFRLALLHLRDEGGKGDVHAQAVLTRLKKEYPRSIWTRQAAPLTAYLAGVGALRDSQRELKTLRERSQSLIRDNKELRQSLERLKNLDIELEQKIQR